jgi:diguanylate cyclase
MIDKLREEIARLRVEVITDPLTSLVNRRGFDEALARCLGGVFCLSLIDLDHFKMFNDKHGHRAGDAALRHVAQTLRSYSPAADIVARYGGDEFVIIHRDSKLEEAYCTACHLCDKVADTPLVRDEQLIRFMASFGVTEATPNDTADSLLDRVDKALYGAKRNGRGCVYCK